MKAKKTRKIRVTRTGTRLVVLLTLALSLGSCNLTRVVTTESKFLTQGDTTTTIVSKTIETYDATKKNF